MIMAIHSNIRHWRRCERRAEIALVIGPVAPLVMSVVPTCPACVASSIVPIFLVVCDSLLLFKLEASLAFEKLVLTLLRKHSYLDTVMHVMPLIAHIQR